MEENNARIWDGSSEEYRLDIPRRGHVLTTTAEKYGKPIRDVVEVLTDSLAKKNCNEIREALLPSSCWRVAPVIVRTDAEMLAWSIVSIWATSVAVRAIPKTAGLRDAEQWFFGEDNPERLTDFLSGRVINQVEVTLRADADASAYYELLPYILDPHGPGSRASVRRNPATSATQIRKRKEGVFYTPADVAEYMVRGCLGSINHKKAPTIFDLACGTGVFLRAALKDLRQHRFQKSTFSLASGCLFGTDIDPWPLDAAAFVLLTDIWIDEAKPEKTPVKLWRRLRLNLRCIDTLRIDPATTPLDDIVDEGMDRISISELFPELEDEPTVIVGNPPYTYLGERPDLGELGQVFKTLEVKQQANAETYPAFIEQMTRLANRKECAGALVVPLSIACNIGPQFVAARQLMQKTASHWRFAFFDREPHALFGEDVKIRNTILFWSRIKSDTSTVLASGPLRKWRGNSRAAMFNSIRFTKFEGDIRTGIPKIDGACQTVALQILNARWSYLEQAVHGVERLNLAEALNADGRMVFVGPTAYNFLNVFLRPQLVELNEKLMLSEHPLHAIKCASAKDALAIFAILTSHLAYWWWHTYGDGFHVSRRFILEFPFGLDVWSGEAAGRLSESGATLWSAIKGHPIISLNRGRTSLAYSPNGYDNIRRTADEILADIAGLNDGFVDELQHFTVHTVAARLRGYGGSDTHIEGEEQW